VFAIAVAIRWPLTCVQKATSSVASRGQLGYRHGGVIALGFGDFSVSVVGSLTVPFLVWRKCAHAAGVGNLFRPVACPSRWPRWTASFVGLAAAVSPLPEWSLGYIYLPAMVGIAATQ